MHTAPAADAHSAHDEHGHGEFHAHVMPIPVLLGVFFALLGLTALTVWSSTFPLGSWDVTLAMLIATVKALLICLFFMHMLYDKPLNVMAFLSSIIFMALFIGLSLSDYGEYKPEVDAWDNSRTPQAVAPATPPAS